MGPGKFCDNKKKALCEAPILRHPDFDRDFNLQIDACQEGLAAALSQYNDDGKDHLIMYLNMAEREWTVRVL